MGMILDDIAQVCGEKLPTSHEGLVALVRKAAKMDAITWKKFKSDSRAYLNKAIKELQKPNPQMDSDGLLFIGEHMESIVDEDESDDEEIVTGAAPSHGLTELELVELLSKHPEINCRTQFEAVSIETLVSRYNRGVITKPDIQREFVWKAIFKYKFLNTVRLGFPTQCLMLTFETANKYFVIDGFQRLSTILEFINNKITMGPFGPFPNKYFKDLPKSEQEKFLLRKLPVLECEVEKKHWAFLFDNINTSMPLKPMEKRRILFSHPALLIIEDLTKPRQEHTWWNVMFGKKIRYQGTEALLRSVAMHHIYAQYNKPMETFLLNFCDQMNDLESVLSKHVDANRLHHDIDNILEAMHTGLGKKAFRMPNSRSSNCNLSLIDCLFHGAFLVLEADPKTTTKELAGILKTLKNDLFENEQTRNALTKDTSGKEAVFTRMRKTEEIIKSLFVVAA